MTTTVEQQVNREIEATRGIDRKVAGIERDAKRRIRILRVFGIDLGYEIDMCLETLANYLEDPAGKYFPFSVAELDRIVAGETNQNDPDPAEDAHRWMDEIFKRLNWWKGIAIVLLDGARLQDDEKKRSEILSLFADVLAAYIPALKSGYSFDCDYENNGPRLEVLRRYHLFTRYVCAFAQEVWPDVNLERLLQQP